MKRKYFDMKKLVVVLCIMLMAVQMLPGQANRPGLFNGGMPMIKIIKDKRGIASLEVMFLIPIFLFLTVMGMEIGFITDTQLKLTACAREGARVAAMYSSVNAGKSAASAAASKYNLKNFSVDVRKSGYTYKANVKARYYYLSPGIWLFMGGREGNDYDILEKTVVYRQETPVRP